MLYDSHEKLSIFLLILDNYLNKKLPFIKTYLQIQNVWGKLSGKTIDLREKKKKKKS